MVGLKMVGWKNRESFVCQDGPGPLCRDMKGCSLLAGVFLALELSCFLHRHPGLERCCDGKTLLHFFAKHVQHPPTANSKDSIKWPRHIGIRIHNNG